MEKQLLGLLADIQTGPFGSQLHKEDYVDEGTPIVTVEHLGNRIFTEQNLPLVSEEDKNRLSKYVLKEGDIVFSRVGSVDRCSYVDRNHAGWMFSGRCLRVRPNSKVYPLYMYYYFCLEDTKQFVRNIAVGATMPSINTKLLSEIKVMLPSLLEQQAIASVLSTIDEKIELNNAINDNLEKQARVIYAEMFVNNAKLKTSEGTLSDIAVITMGQSPSGSSYNEDDKGQIFYQGRAEFGFRFPTRHLYTTEPNRIAEEGDVLLSVRAPVGDLNVAYERCCIGRGLGAIHSKNGYSSFILYTMFNLKRQLDIFNGEGTVFGSINKDSLNAMPILIPQKEVIERFESIVRPIDELIKLNYAEILRLETLRDSLMPKLMSGELDVSEVNL